MKHNPLITMVIAILIFTTTSLSFAHNNPVSLVVATWNVESDGAQAEVIAASLAEFQGVDIWGLTEVKATDQDTFVEAAAVGENADFEGILSDSGRSDRLLILYDAVRFEALGHDELDQMNPDGTVRSPLVAHFLDHETQQEFLFMVNHLARGNEARRHEQARQLNDWADDLTLPVIAVGDYNFDYDVETETHDAGFDLLTEDNVFTWVRPAELVLTQCSVQSDDTCRFNSVLDFIFAASEAQDWNATSAIIVKSGQFPDDDTTSDHRPVTGEFLIVGGQDAVTREALLERIEQLEAELAELRALVEQLP